MLNKKVVFRILYLLFGLLCALTISIAAVGGKPAGWWIGNDKKKYGELYAFCKISTFKTPLPPIEYPQNIPDHPITESEIIFIGDSYFGNIYGKFFERETGVPVYNILLKLWQKPQEALEELHYTSNGKQKYLVFEKAERSLQQGYLTWEKKAPSLWDTANNTIKKYLIPTDSLEFLVSENLVMSCLLEIRNTFRFSFFKDISALTPVYSISPPMLHYQQAVDGNRLIKTDCAIDIMADKIEAIGKSLQQKYGLTLIFMAVPNKYTIYGYDYKKYNYNTKGESYDNFLPRLQERLEERGVLSLNLYKEFMDSNEPVCEPSHDHWNYRGMTLALNRLVEMYQNEEHKRTTNNPKKQPD